MPSYSQMNEFKSVEDELLKEIKDLSGEKLARGQPRKVYLERLHELKKWIVFRFLDLPAEMRNRVYGEVLVHDHDKNACAVPALLRTCKQIHHEGVSILNAESVPRLHIFFAKGCQAGSLWHFSYGEYCKVALKDSQAVSAIIRSQRRVENVRVTIDTEPGWWSRKTKEPSTRTLGIFFGQLMGKKSVRVELSHEWKRLMRAHGWGMMEVLKPLRDLKRSGILTLAEDDKWCLEAFLR